MLGGAIDGIFDTRNDSLVDTDGDGIADLHETATGIYLSASDTGTSPTDPDSDRDGQSDGAELVAGTDPNSQADHFQIEVALDEWGEVQISWCARAGRRFAVEFWDPVSGAEAIRFRTLQEISTVEVALDGPATVVVSRPAGVSARLFRVVAWMKNP